MILSKITDKFFNPDQRRLKKLLKDISADQAEIFLKTVHPEIWQKLLDRAIVEKQTSISSNTNAKQIEERKKVRWPFKLAALGTIGFVGFYHLTEFDLEDFDHYGSKFSEWKREGASIFFDEIPQQIRKLQEKGTQLADQFFIEINKHIDTVEAKAPTQLAIPELKDGVLGTGSVRVGFNQITKSDVNIRVLPSHTAKSLGTAKMGSCIYVLNIMEGGWVYFRAQDKNSNLTEGYMAGSRLTPLIGQTAKCTFVFEAK